MKKSKIKFVKQEQGWTSKDNQQFNKVEVTFDNGDVYGFSTPAPSKFSYVVGDIINYEVTSEKYKSAKALGVDTKKAEFGYKKTLSTNDSIIRQVAFKGAIELATKGVIKLDDIEQFTNEFNQLLK